MAQDPAPEVHLSPDGRFWWDGVRWQPVRSDGNGGIHPFLIVAGLLVLLAGALGLLFVVVLGPVLWEMYQLFR